MWSVNPKRSEMFEQACKSVQEQLTNTIDGHSGYGAVQLSANDLPKTYTSQQLCIHLVDSIKDRPQDGLRSLVIIEGCLRHSQRLIREQGDFKYVRSLLSWVSISINPSADLIAHDEDNGDQKDAAETALARSSFMSLLGVNTIRLILTVYQVEDTDLGFDVLLNLVAFTDVRDAWTSDQVQNAASNLLDDYVKRIQADDFIVDFILNGFIRPLFSMSKPKTITHQGRKAINSGDSRRRVELDQTAKPWKFEQVSAVTVLRWVANQSDEPMISKCWHLLMPPLFTLLDDTSTNIRVSGLEITKTILEKMPAKVLKQTGLGEVFEDAIMPTLHFLPSLTPVDESVRLLRPAYEALFALGDVRYPTREDRPDQLRFMDRIMRQGVLQGIEYCRENVIIIELLLAELDELISRMDIHAIKHLKDIVPILSATLSDPFSPSRPELLAISVKTLQTTILNCWPRMRESVHRLEIVKALCICWVNISGDVGQYDAGLPMVKNMLQLTGKMLAKSVEGVVDIREELAPLISVDGSLGVLFGLPENP